MAVLPCTISKSLGGRFLISVDVLERLFHHVIDLHGESVQAASFDEKEFIAKRVPVLEISYLDGTKYEIRDLKTFRKVIPGNGKRIEGFAISSNSGDLTATIRSLGYLTRPCFEVRASGLEDRIAYFVETSISEVKRETDITITARRIWPMFTSFLISSAIFLSAKIVFDIDEKKWWTAVFLALPIFVMVLSLPIELLREKWLPPVGYLWGEDGKRASRAKTVVKACLISLPLWLIGTLAQTFIK